jgi:flagellar protein FlbD
VIRLTRLSGTSFAINPDLIERVDATPDTVLTLVDGTKYVVSETLDNVTEAVRYYRASLLAIAARIEVSAAHLTAPGGSGQRGHLHAVSDEEAGKTADDRADDDTDRFDDAVDAEDANVHELAETVQLHSRAADHRDIHPYTDTDDVDDDAPTARIVALPGGEI